MYVRAPAVGVRNDYPLLRLNNALAKPTGFAAQGNPDPTEIVAFSAVAAAAPYRVVVDDDGTAGGGPIPRLGARPGGAVDANHRVPLRTGPLQVGGLVDVEIDEDAWPGTVANADDADYPFLDVDIGYVGSGGKRPVRMYRAPAGATKFTLRLRNAYPGAAGVVLIARATGLASFEMKLPDGYRTAHGLHDIHSSQAGEEVWIEYIVDPSGTIMMGATPFY